MTADFKAKKLTENIQETDGEANEAKHKISYTTYSERWWILGTVVLLNFANYAHWIAFPAVAKKAAAYYDVSGEALDLIPTVSYAAGVPTCLIATYLIESRGLRTGVKIGAYLTGVGGLLCCLSTFPGLNQHISKEYQYWMAVIGQGITGVACPFISGVPTKISQHWFPDRQRTMATSLLGMSYPLGIVLGQGVTPALVQLPSDIPYMNIGFFVPALIGAILGIILVKNNLPPTPPSASEEQREMDENENMKKINYLGTLKMVFTNKAFVIMFFVLGGNMSFISTLATKMEQIMCSVGYSDEIAGLTCTVVIIVGALGTVILGVMAEKTRKIVEITKLCCLGNIICVVIMSYLLLQPDVGVYILISAGFLGFFAIGVFPLALEVAVEATFPADQATVTCFIFFSSSVQGVFLMVIENWLGFQLSDEYLEKETCTVVGSEGKRDPEGHLQPKDYTYYLMFVTLYLLVLILLYMFFFKTELRRTIAGSVRRQTVSFTRTEEKDVESLIPSEEGGVRAISPMRKLISVTRLNTSTSTT